MKEYIKSYGRAIFSGIGFFYDFKRYFFYSGRKMSFKQTDFRNYYVVKTYHSLEKSMSFKNRKKGSGWKDVDLLFKALKPLQNKSVEEFGFHDKIALQVLQKFINLEGNKNTPEYFTAIKELNMYPVFFGDSCGSNVLVRDYFSKGILQKPEEFFQSRFSVREFDEGKLVDAGVIERAIDLAMKSPSACNRQPWHVYTVTGRALIDRVLSYQTGNRGFGHKINNLLIITADLRAYTPGSERYQHWIDGGLFSMSLILALHSLGIASCCLNWSKSAKHDKQFRKLNLIDESHTIIMMLAVGYPDATNTVCVSARRPKYEIITELK